MGLFHQHYEARVKAGEIKADIAQDAAVKPLDTCLDALTAKRSWFGLGKAKPIKGVYLWGGVGSGKSMLMDMFASFAAQAGVKSKRFHFHDFMTAVHDNVRDPELSKYDDPAQHVAGVITDNAKLLCFDEMEVKDIADAMILARVMGGFFAGGGVLVATSNRHPDDLYANGLHRERFLPFIASLSEHTIIHDIASATDWRRRVLAGMTGWYYPDDTDACRTMRQTFDKLSGGCVKHSASVTVAGRKMTFDHVAGSVVLSDFDTLCASPLAARDYLALAERFAGIFIQNIPCLSDELRNEARRFIWLVDAFYDRERFLVASATTSIEKIYQGKAWQFEFPRTVSRLTEMSKISEL